VNVLISILAVILFLSVLSVVFLIIIAIEECNNRHDDVPIANEDPIKFKGD